MLQSVDRPQSYTIGIDTGGTFTDISIVGEYGDVWNAKAPSTPRDFSVGFLNALREGAQVIGIPEEQLLGNAEIIHVGMTVATNALINRKGAKTGLITTRGFEDGILIMKARGKCLGLSELEIKHQARCMKPMPIVPKQLIRGVTERVDCFGNVVVSLDENDALEAIRSLVEAEGCDSLAIAFLWSLRNPDHERRVRDLVKSSYPQVETSISYEIAPLVGEYERTVTTVFNAYLKPETKSFLHRLQQSLEERQLRASLMVMQAHGGVATGRHSMEAPVFTIGSGPTGGVMASLAWARALGYDNVITTDVGGTSFDVGVIVGGLPVRTTEAVIDQYRLRLPKVDVVSIGAGGGSIAWVDPITGTLKVGPQSVGGDPGPAAYDRGGTLPTLTDADVVLGYLNPDFFLSGQMRLNPQRSHDAIRTVAEPLGMSVEEAALGIRRIATSHMADLIQNQVLMKGYDPKSFAMFLFGGAGPQFGAEYGRLSRCPELVMLYPASTFSAFGIASSAIVYTEARSELYVMPVEANVLNAAYRDLEDRVLAALEQEGFDRSEVVIARIGELRYGRQVNYVEVPVPGGGLTQADVEAIVATFEQRYESLYGRGSGYRASGIELVNLRIFATMAPRQPVLNTFPAGAKAIPTPAGARRVRTTDGWIEAVVYRWDQLRPANEMEGPAVVEGRLTTGVIPAGMMGHVDEYLNIHLRSGSTD